MVAVTDMDQLDGLSDDELWSVAANTRIAADIRHEAMQRWLYPEETNPDVDPEEIGGGRMRELRARATIMEQDELEEDDIEELDRRGPYFDGQGRLLVEYNGVQYLIDSDDEEMDEDYADVS
ncbi:MAG: hypothetical protein IT324_12600 [Anaerolineae bacterium]|nr:hypothetical protein [Anaerolineae bacterium]